MNSLPESQPPARPKRSWTTRLWRDEWSERCPTWCRRSLTVLAVLPGVAVVPVALMTSRLPDPKEIREAGNATKITRLYDSQDRLLLSVEKEERTPVPLSSVSPHMVKAVIAIEDQRFYNHLGVDVVRMGSALMTDIKERRFVEGASTITQQLARQLFLDDRKTLWRKGREIILALRIERQFEKDKILELYLNEVYFGHGYYGVEAAARGYFGKPASALTLPESALLAGVVKAPSHYSPRAHLDKSRTRRDLVLDQMVDAGYIDRQTAEHTAKAPIALTCVAAETPFARYFKNYVVRTLVERLGEEAVYEGGLRVYTTLDPELQRAADLALKEGLQTVEARQRLARADRRTGDAVPAGRHRRDDARRPDRGARRRPRFQRQRVRPRHAGQTAAGLRLQAVHLRRGARVRADAVDAAHRTLTSARRSHRAREARRLVAARSA